MILIDLSESTLWDYALAVVALGVLVLALIVRANRRRRELDELSSAVTRMEIAISRLSGGPGTNSRSELWPIP